MNKLIEDYTTKEIEDKEPSIYLPEFIPFYPEVLDIGLNYLQGLIYGFIRFYLSSSESGKSFYFSNKQLAKLFRVSETSISTTISKLAKVGLIELEYRIKANGGKIRLIRLKENLKSDFKKTLSWTLKKFKENKNKKNKNKKNINTNSITNKSEFGNPLINFLLKEIESIIGKKLPVKYGKERNIAKSMVELLTKQGKNGIKKGREWLFEDPKQNIKDFLKTAKDVIYYKKIDLNYLNTLHAWLKLYMASKGKEIMGIKSPRMIRWEQEQAIQRTKEQLTEKRPKIPKEIAKKIEDLSKKFKME